MTITIYTKPGCPYCADAKQLLNDKDAAFHELDILQDPNLRGQMIEKAGGRKTVPQIFIGDTHVGGCDDLYALDSRGELDALLNA